MIIKHSGNEGEIERISCSLCRSDTEHEQCQKDANDLLKCKVCNFETKKTSYMRRHTHIVHGINADVSTRNFFHSKLGTNNFFH